ncbi:hypothetical protein Anapl_01187 [Anas platyrhynchos]|uniref:Protein kinase domain-containing protein n=1 Tax=Anas platyrhynchos TaxID=8839 RepID=R0K6N1_ANAPL|nr:hypothetical protein Anapl_01187 [Anas platyrhynchos]
MEDLSSKGTADLSLAFLLTCQQQQLCESLALVSELPHEVSSAISPSQPRRTHVLLFVTTASSVTPLQLPGGTHQKSELVDDLLADSSGSTGKFHAASTTSSSRPLAWMDLQLEMSYGPDNIFLLHSQHKSDTNTVFHFSCATEAASCPLGVLSFSGERLIAWHPAVGDLSKQENRQALKTSGFGSPAAAGGLGHAKPCSVSLAALCPAAPHAGSSSTDVPGRAESPFSKQYKGCLFQKGRKFLQLYPDGSTESLNWPKPQLPPRGNVMVTLPPLHIFSAPALPLVNNCSKKHATNPQPGEPLNTKIKNSFPFLGQLGYEDAESARDERLTLPPPGMLKVLGKLQLLCSLCCGEHREQEPAFYTGQVCCAGEEHDEHDEHVNRVVLATARETSSSREQLFNPSACVGRRRKDPAGIFELVEVVGNGTYGQVYKLEAGVKEMAGEAARPSWGGRCKRQDARSRLVPPVFALHVFAREVWTPCRAGAHKVWTPCRAGHNFLLVIQARFYSENQNSSEMGMPVGPAVAFDYSQPPSCRGKIPPEPPEAASVRWGTKLENAKFWAALLQVRSADVIFIFVTLLVCQGALSALCDKEDVTWG